MLLFYHGIGVLLLMSGTYVIERLTSDYEEPMISRSLIHVLAAGPIEETIFFGIPYYISGSPHITLITGAIWATFHLLNTNVLSMENLAFANWLFVVPSLFFSLRAWVSGKGWFAVVAHSGWNGALYLGGCVSGEFICNISEGNDYTSIMTTLLMAGALLLFVYILSKEQQAIKKIREIFNSS